MMGYYDEPDSWASGNDSYESFEPQESPLGEMFKRVVIENGHRALMNTPFCRYWIKNHNMDCRGCSSEVGCNILAEMAKLIQGKIDMRNMITRNFANTIYRKAIKNL